MSIRPYNDGCAVAHGAELLGERWALLVVRELLLGPKRYGDLQRGLGKISPTVLGARLRELEAAGILFRDRLGPPTSAIVYGLTEWGQQLEPFVLGLARWAGRSTHINPAYELGADSLVLHMQARYSPEHHDAVAGRFNLQVGADSFAITTDERGLSARRGSFTSQLASATVSTTVLTAVLRGVTSIDDALAEGALQAEGDVPALCALLEACGGRRS